MKVFVVLKYGVGSVVSHGGEKEGDDAHDRGETRHHVGLLLVQPPTSVGAFQRVLVLSS